MPDGDGEYGTLSVSELSLQKCDLGISFLRGMIAASKTTPKPRLEGSLNLSNNESLGEVDDGGVWEEFLEASWKIGIRGMFLGGCNLERLRPTVKKFQRTHSMTIYI